MLCDLALTFPSYVATLLERDRHLKRNFREETVTDLLMASLIGLEKFGIRVDFPDEPTTGGDMDWIYAAPLELGGGRYLRLLLQAKRAQYAKLNSGGYWFYKHLDHGTPKGQQAQVLINYAASSPDGMKTCPLFILYHPHSALAPAMGSLPEIEGVNLIFADDVAPVVNGGCSRAAKRVHAWRSGFMPLSEILCWPIVINQPPPDGSVLSSAPTFIPEFHPDLVANRLQQFRDLRREIQPTKARSERPNVEAAWGIPDEIKRAILGEVSVKERKALKRPRVILSTPMVRGDVEVTKKT